MQTNHNLKSLPAAFPDTILILSPDGLVVEHHTGQEAPLFLPESNPQGQHLETLLPPQLTDQILYFLQQSLSCKEKKTCELTLPHLKENHTCETQFVYLSKDRVMVTLKNITQRKNAEKRFLDMMMKLEESHAHMTTILDHLRVGTALIDQEGLITYLSEGGQTILKLSENPRDQKWNKALPLPSSIKEQIKQLMNIAPHKRLKIPAQVLSQTGQTWLEIEIKDDPQDARKKIFLFYDVTELHSLKKRLGEQNQFHDMIGHSSLMQQVYAQIRELAPLNVTVLIQGETGTGKELAAKALHYESKRKDKPFIPVNCAGLTEGSLLMSQLFGHKRGAFTGAIQDQKGLLESADGGTLFLDELGDIPLDVQTSLLRFLQEKEITRVGESQPRKVDVRILAATQYNLMERVQQGHFRMDLYYRIHVASVLLPPLRDRREDIPLLSQSFILQSSQRVGKAVKNIQAQTAQWLLQHDWPGNIRELQGVIEAAVIRCSDHSLALSDLPDTIKLGNTHSNHIQNEDQRIKQALSQTQGNRSKAAKLLGISRATFYRKLQKLDIAS